MIRKAIGAIVTRGNDVLLVYKTKINTPSGKLEIQGEWDIVKGGVKEKDLTFKAAVLRELEEETGTREFSFIKEFDEKLEFDFPEEIQRKIGFQKQETMIFHLEYKDDAAQIRPVDDEINETRFVPKDEVLELLTHEDTKVFLVNYFL